MGKTSYCTVNGQIRSEHRSGESRSRDYALDPFGNVMAVYQADWAVAYMSFDPWGERVSGWNDSSYRFTWAGGHGYRQTSLEWATHYVRARHYSFMDGSWTAVDPLWPSEPAYRYVGGRVPKGVDPSGKAWCLKCGDLLDDSKIKGPSGECLIACIADELKAGTNPGVAVTKCIAKCIKGGLTPVKRDALVRYALCISAQRSFKLKGDCSPCDEKSMNEVPNLQGACCDYIYLSCMVNTNWDYITSKGVTQTASVLAKVVSPSYGMGLNCIQNAQNECGDDTYCGAGIDGITRVDGKPWIWKQ